MNLWPAKFVTKFITSIQSTNWIGFLFWSFFVLSEKKKKKETSFNFYSSSSIIANTKLYNNDNERWYTSFNAGLASSLTPDFITGTPFLCFFQLSNAPKYVSSYVVCKINSERCYVLINVSLCANVTVGTTRCGRIANTSSCFDKSRTSTSRPVIRHCDGHSEERRPKRQFEWKHSTITG